MREISEIWIIINGITVYNQQKESNIDAVLMGGFFSAIQNFITEIGESELKSIMLGTSKIMIYRGMIKEREILYISRSSEKVKDKNIIKHLQLVETKFTDLYGDIVQHWDGNTDVFKDLDQQIQEIFQKTPEKDIESTFW